MASRRSFMTPVTAIGVTGTRAIQHGTPIADPYRSLEDSDAPASREWIATQNELTARILRAGAPWRRGDCWCQLRNTGLQDQDVLWTADGPEAEGTVLFDPNRLSEEGTTALSAVAVAESGELVACATSDAGSDWRTWGVLEDEVRIRDNAHTLYEGEPPTSGPCSNGGSTSSSPPRSATRTGAARSRRPRCCYMPPRDLRAYLFDIAEACQLVGEALSQAMRIPPAVLAAGTERPKHMTPRPGSANGRTLPGGRVTRLVRARMTEIGTGISK